MVLHRTVIARLISMDYKAGKTGQTMKKIADKTVRPSAKMKKSTNVNQGKKQNVCVAFCSNNHLVSYVKSTDYILTLKKLGPAKMRHINR